MQGKLQFGDFELDRDAMELRRHGLPIRLQDQPLRVLALLLERPGEIVGRETLRERIWGSDTFVDFEQSLNKAVNRLREALDDEAGQPRFVETVPRRGYRFIAPVSVLSAVEAPPPPPPPPKPVKSSRHLIAITTIAVVLAVMVVGAMLFWRKPQKFEPPETKQIASAAVCCPRLSRDGKLLAYVSDAGGGKLHIWIQQTAGGEAIPVTRDSDGEIGEDFSPDGTHLAFVSEGAIRIAPTLSGDAKMLASTDGGYPLFSPNGQQVLYWQSAGAMIVSVDSGERVSPRFNREFLVHGPPLWSPSGDAILFYGVSRRESEKPDGYWIAPLTAGDARPLHLPTGQSGIVDVCAWVRDKKGDEWMLFSVSQRESWSLYRVRVSSQGRFDGRPELVTTGTDSLGYSVSVSDDGELVYPTNSFRQSVFEIPMDSKGQKSGPMVQLPFSDGGDYRSPSLSRNGRWMAYDAYNVGKANAIRWRDLESGSDRILDEKGRPSWGGETILSPDGSKVVFERDCQNGKFIDDGRPLPCVFMMSTAGGEAEQVCEFCTPRGFSSDGSALLIQNYHRDGQWPHVIDVVDLKSRSQKGFLNDPDGSVYHAFFSWDDHWVVFKTQSSLGSRKTPIMIAPVRDGAAGKKSEWIAITDGQYRDDKPQFAPDGNTVYFISPRDGYFCIWSQRLDPSTKHPVGAPIAYEHIHNATQRDAGGFSNLENDADLSVAQNRMVITLPEFRGQIWMTQIK